MASGILSTIAYVAGKSGGHIVPCLTLMLQQPMPNASLFFTTNARIDQQIMQSYQEKHIRHASLPLGSSYNRWYKKPLLLWHLLVSFVMSLYMLWQYRPSKLITTGGIVAIPVCVAAFILRIPIILYELNVFPGRAATVIGYFATEIRVCFADAHKHFAKERCCIVPYPVKYAENDMISKEDACRQLDFDSAIPTMLILGGSQGSVQLNELVKVCIEKLQSHSCPIQVIHQTGNDHSCDWQQWYKDYGVDARVFAYHDKLAPYLAAADLVVCRAGAGTLFEVMHFKKPAIIIPLEGVADNHQVANAYAIQKDCPALCTVVRCTDTQTSIQVHDAIFQKIRSVDEL